MTGEFITPQVGDYTANKLKRIDRECDRRIQAIYPLQDQINILFSLLSKKIGVQITGEYARDQDRAAAYLRTVQEHRLAAEIIKKFVSENPALAAALDVSESARWPKPERRTK